MTAELVRGQNHILPQTRLEIRISAGSPVVAGATLADESGTVRGAEWVAHPGAHRLPGLEVSRQAAAGHRLAVDLEALPEAVHRVTVLLALPVGTGGPARFGATAAPFAAVTGLDGTEIATFTLTGLDAETAVNALELYRRQGAWKVRAVGQGYATGLAGMLTDQGLPSAAELAATIQEAVARSLARSVAPPPPRTPEADRLRQTSGPHAPPPAPSGPTTPSVTGISPVTGTSPGPGTGPATDPATPTAGAPTPGTPTTPAPGTPTPAAAGTTAPTGPINYAHPRRRPSAPPAPPAPPPTPAP
ncbi:export associated protein, partial [Streptomyces sp. ZL-24]|uniref:TerD family protein n=1 Tax=Streptomyces sp. ZL-24 TaxID=1933029 RepID=UPI000D446D39